FSAECTKSPPEEEEALARLLQSAIELVSHELPSCSFETRRSGRLLTVHARASGAKGGRQIGVCNRSWRGGGLTRQVAALLADLGADVADELAGQATGEFFF